MSAAADLHERMQAFRARFIERARQDRSQLDGAWNARDGAAIARICHGLAGNAGMFGFPDIGDLARRLEEAALDAALADSEALFLSLRDRLDALDSDGE